MTVEKIDLGVRLQLLTDLQVAFYGIPGNGAGGGLHIVLDDGNMEDHHLVFCYRELHREAHEQSRALGLVILHELMMLSSAQRLAWYEEWDYRSISLLRGVEVKYIDGDDGGYKVWTPTGYVSVHDSIQADLAAWNSTGVRPLTAEDRGDLLRQGIELPKAPVYRGHCNRCDRCGELFATDVKYGCVPNNCARRALPDLRTTCAGCGAPFDMTDAEKEEQRRSFAHGNLKIDRPEATRVMVDRAAEDLEKNGG